MVRAGRKVRRAKKQREEDCIQICILVQVLSLAWDVKVTRTYTLPPEPQASGREPPQGGYTNWERVDRLSAPEFNRCIHGLRIPVPIVIIVP